MTTISRRPLASRPLPLQLPSVVSPLRAMTRNFSSKRARSPDLVGDAQSINGTVKRSRPAEPALSMTVATREEERERRRAEREAQKEEFRVKYTKAFPSWTFYFDLDMLDPETASLRETLEAKVSHMGARVEDFFSSQITHLITRQMVPEDAFGNKENFHRGRPSQAKPGSMLRSPIKLRGRAGDDLQTRTTTPYDIIQKATSFGIKIWTTTKLESVLDRLLPASVTPPQPVSVQDTSTVAITRQRSLTRLLESERLYGTTTERDPTQKRHDYRYFSRASCFVLVEDMRQELATIAAMEYPITKTRDGTEKGAWPVLYCHPLARGPFIEFDDREKRRYEKSLRTETDKEEKREAKGARMRQQEQCRRTQVQLHMKKVGDLRRSVSMNNLHRRTPHFDPGFELVDVDADGCDTQDSANASGYLASTGNGTYMAASGNSVGITSTTGTTSTAGHTLRNLQLPSALRERLQQQVVTSRKAPAASTNKDQSNRTGAMGPPVALPERPNGLLRKSRSTNTFKLSKREEGSKPGYCESCRVRFDDFKAHIRGRKHRKFAVDDANFVHLDCVLARVQRRTVQQLEAEQSEWEARYCGEQVSGLDYCDDLLSQFPHGEVDDDDDETTQSCEVGHVDWDTLAEQIL